MKNFEYFTPKNVEEACSLLDRYQEEAKIIAGGQSLLILMKNRLISPKYLIDIKGISEMDYIIFDKQEGLKVGALTTHRSIECSSLIQGNYPVLSEMETRLASIQIRNWGTVGGNLCHSEPAGDVAPVLIALKGKVRLRTKGEERIMLLEDFFKDYYESVLKPNELLVEIQVPKSDYPNGAAYAKLSLRENDMAIGGVAVVVEIDPPTGICRDTRIVMSAVGPTPIRAKKAEAEVIGRKKKDISPEAVAQSAKEEAQPISDSYASEDYKREMIGVLMKSVLNQAWNKAIGNRY